MCLVLFFIFQEIDKDDNEEKTEHEFKREEGETDGMQQKPEEEHHEKESEDDDWDKFQEELKKENSLDTVEKKSHPVHCPYFPEVIIS